MTQEQFGLLLGLVAVIGVAIILVLWSRLGPYAEQAEALKKAVAQLNEVSEIVIGYTDEQEKEDESKNS